MMCSVHGKARTARNLEDDGDGGYKCTNGNECVRVRKNAQLPGDATCSHCGAHQLATNTRCHTCVAPNPRGGNTCSGNNRKDSKEEGDEVRLKVCILMWYDEAMEEYADLNREMNRRYCERHGLDLVVSSSRERPERGPHWERFSLMLKHIRDYDYMVWIDADAYFYPGARDIRSLIDVQKDFTFSRGGPGGPMRMVNSGVFVAKSSDYSVQFLLEWAFNDERYNNRTLPQWQDQAVLFDLLRENALGIQEHCSFRAYGTLQHLREVGPRARFDRNPLILHLAGAPAGARIKASGRYTSPGAPAAGLDAT
ncbi:unnamed protein product [Prorocentrum cordatum]|uniref:Nucleotide-diphospho-sugar transferase domain-containing protein n=1 Tax=Prorocentrum cordatum TaxID=2364126 RepID=A0ABN9V645_9DINO|nr:unnamed protein product [Polarella glacialis]